MAENANKCLKYSCEICHFKCSKLSNYNAHLITNKHKLLINPNNNPNKKNAIKFHLCNNCGKKYKHLSSLCAHKKNCDITNEINQENTIIAEENTIITEENNEEKKKTEEELRELKTMFMKMIEMNQDLQKQLFELAKESKSIINSNTTNNNNCNNTNNNFNLNFFLNETCKDASNITDFVNGIKLGLDDFERFGTIGYAGSISNVLVRELKALDVTKRPIHCSDLKRDVLHIKDNNNTWVKDDDKKLMKRAILSVEHKNIQLISEYAKAHPEVNDPINFAYEYISYHICIQIWNFLELLCYCYVSRYVSRHVSFRK